MSVSNIFPNPDSEVFGFNGIYYTVDTLINGVGYWVKYNNSQILHLCGSIIDTTINVNAGWNLIGPFNEQVPVQNISSQPPNIIIPPLFGFETIYIPVDTIKPGIGYWVKTNANGTIQFNQNNK